jgi:hypothetical protein
MIRKISLAVAAVVTVAALASVVLTPGTAAQEPGPSAGTVLTGGLLQPRGLVLGPDGMLYVAEAGTGGETDFTLEGQAFKNGYTGRISRIDPETGDRETVVDGLPSNAFAEQGDAVGPADVAFIGNDLYYIQTHAGAVWGFPDFETGVYRVDDDGDLTLIADIGEFNVDNPVDDIAPGGVQEDIEPGGNPYSMIARNGALYVTDGNQNQVMRVTTTGTISRIAELSGHEVTTGITYSGSGPFYMTYLGTFPFAPEQGKVLSLPVGGGTPTLIASGASMLTDAGVGPGGQLYAVQFADTAGVGPEGIGPFTGSILRVSGSTTTKLITGLSLTTAILFDGNTAYVSNWGAGGEGQIIKVENFSSVQPPAPSPTAAPSTPAPASPVPATATPRGGTIGAPDTGSGGYTSDGGNFSWVVLGALAAAGMALVGGSAVTRRR